MRLIFRYLCESEHKIQVRCVNTFKKYFLKILNFNFYSFLYFFPLCPLMSSSPKG